MRNMQRQSQIQIETGTVFMNRADYVDQGLCWTGCKDTVAVAHYPPLVITILPAPNHIT